MAQSKTTSRRGENFSNYQSQETESNRLANQPIPTEVPLPAHCRNDYLSTRKRMPGEEEEGESKGEWDDELKFDDDSYAAAASVVQGDINKSNSSRKRQKCSRKAAIDRKRNRRFNK